MTPRRRMIAFAIACLLVLGGTGAFLLWRGGRAAKGSDDAAVQTVAARAFEGKPRIVFRDMAAGADYGKVAVVSLDDPGGPRAVTGLTCDRVDATASETVCLAQSPLASSFDQTVLTPAGETLFSADLPGLPSRARFSPDGTLVAATGFVAGDSYLDVGFSTRTYITEIGSGKKHYLEDFTLIHEGAKATPVDRNFWGVTFVDDDEFYVTVAFGGEYWLARGSLASRDVETLHDRAECPSISPDQSRVVYKKRQSGENSWRLAVLDLKTGVEQLLVEQRSVDDQVEWLDNSTILYAVPPELARDGDSDIWSLDIDSGGQPTMFIKGAASPSVVR